MILESSRLADAKRTLNPRRTPSGILQVSLPSRHHQGFTLVEICIAMGLCMLILGIGVLSIRGMQDQARLKKSAAEIESTARQTLQEAVSKQQLIELALDGTFGGEGSRVQIKRVGEKTFRNAHSGETWEFSPTGICEPIEVRVTSPAGIIELAFDPLTACAVRKNVSVNG